MKLNLLGGVIVGLFSNLVFYSIWAAGFLRSEEGARVLFLVSAVHATAIILVLSRHRAAALPEAVPFAQLFGAGLFLSFIAGVVTSIGSYIFTTQVDPTYLGWIVEQSLEHLKTLGLNEAELAAETAALPSRVTPASYAVQGLVGVCITGFFLTLVISALLRLRAIQLVNSQKAPSPPTSA